MSEYEARVYDLDGTLVSLDVDWTGVREEVAALFRDRGMPVSEDETLWELLMSSEEYGVASAVEAVIARHECAGARRSTVLPAAAELEGVSEPVAVCSLNAEEACRIALETHGLRSAVEVIVGRDTVSTYKPDPEPLLVALRALSASPEAAIFIGDSPRDEETAHRANVEFAYVDDDE